MNSIDAKAKEEILTNFKEHLVTDSELSYLKKLELDEMQKLEQELENYIHRTNESQKPVYEVLAKLTAVVPNFMLAKLCHDFLTPFIVSQITLYLSVKSAASIAKSLRAEYLGEVTVYNEPELSASIGSAMGMPYLYNICKEMLKKGFFLRMAEIIEHLPDRDIISVVKRLESTENIVEILRYLTNSEKRELVLANLNSKIREKVNNEITAEEK